MKELPKLIVILGPTASGKTDLAVVLAKKFGGEIVAADSRTIYKGMDIGTAKPQPLRASPLKGEDNACLPIMKGEREGVNRRSGYPTQPSHSSPTRRASIKGRRFCLYKGVRHYLIDIVSPNQTFSAADFKEKALPIINDIIRRGKVPFLVGGTGLYIDAITKNLPLGEAVLPNKKLRAEFERDLKASRASALKKYYQKLLRLDPQIKIDKNNPRRVIRALEICFSGKKFSSQVKAGEPLFRVLEIGVNAPRAELYHRIEKRVDKMMKSGLPQEVCKLSKKYKWTSPGMSGIGYREWHNYGLPRISSGFSRICPNKKISLAEVAEQIKKNTRHYAKRQLTWFRRDKKIKWIKNQAKSRTLVRRFLRVDNRG